VKSDLSFALDVRQDAPAAFPLFDPFMQNSFALQRIVSGAQKPESESHRLLGRNIRKSKVKNRSGPRNIAEDSDRQAIPPIRRVISDHSVT